jgi:hypothetical protein
MGRSLDAWAQAVRNNDPEYQKKQKALAIKRQRQQEKKKSKAILTRRVLLPQGKLTGRTLSALLRSLERQITVKHLELKVEELVIDGKQIRVKFKEDGING